MERTPSSAAARRRLAAVAFVDVVDYTQRVSRDEVEGLERRRQVEDLVRSAVEEYEGRVVKALGDGFMLEFASAVQGVRCALAIQERLREVNRQLPEPAGLRMRIGVHAGDVVEDRGDLYGHAVNIASRLEKIARPGGICVSRDVHSQVRAALPIVWSGVDPERLTRLPEPLEVFEIEPEAGEGLPAAEDLAVITPPATVARKDERTDRGWLRLAAGSTALLAAGTGAGLGFLLLREVNSPVALVTWLFAAQAAKSGVRQVQQAFWERPQAAGPPEEPVTSENTALGWRRLLSGVVLLLAGGVATSLGGWLFQDQQSFTMLSWLFGAATAVKGLALVCAAPTGVIEDEEDEAEVAKTEAEPGTLCLDAEQISLAEARRVGAETQLTLREAAWVALIAFAFAAALGFGGTVPPWDGLLNTVLKLVNWGGAGLSVLVGGWALYDSVVSHFQLAPLDAEIVERCKALGETPVVVSEPLDRALGAYGRIRRVLDEPVWKAAKVPARKNLQDARRQLLTMLERAEQLQLVRRTLEQLRERHAGSAEYRRVGGQYDRQCQRLAAAALLFEELEARIARAYLAVTTHRSRAVAPEAEPLRQLPVAFEALSEVLESLDDPALPEVELPRAEEPQVIEIGRRG